MVNRAVNLMAIFSQFFNVLLFNGHPDETLSARCYRQGFLDGHSVWSKARLLVDWLFKPFHTEHCGKAFVKDVMRAREYIDYLAGTT